MKSSLKKSILTHSLFVIGFFLVTLLLYYPYFLENKQLTQHDIEQALGSNHQLAEYRAATGDEALWMNTMFSGMPAFLNGVQFSGDLLIYTYRVIKLGLPHPEGISFLCFIGFYVLLLAFKVRPWIAFAGALAFGMNGFNTISIIAGHNSKISAVAFIPLIIAGIHLAFTEKRLLGAGLTAFALALQIHTNHMQMVYYTLLITIVYGAFHLAYAIKDKKLKDLGLNVGVLLLAAVIGVLANGGKLWTIYEYGKVSIRGKSELTITSNQSSGLDRDYAFQYSNGITEPLFLFIPNIFGGSSQQELSKTSSTAEALRKAGMDRNQIKQQLKAMPTYWGDQPFSAPYYAGSLVFFLFILSFFILKSREKSWLIFVFGMGIVMSWGANFSIVNDLLFDYLPGYNKFRAVTFNIIVAIFALNVLGFVALERLWSNLNETTFKSLLKTVAVAGGFALLLVIGAGILSLKGPVDARLPEWLIGALREDRASLIRMDALRALFLIVAFAGLIWAHLKQKLGSTLVIVGLSLLVFFDIYGLTTRFLKKEKFERKPMETFQQASEANLYVSQKAEKGERVLNLQNPFNEAKTSYFHESIGGYHGAKIRRYQDLISNCIQPEMAAMINQLRNGERSFSNNPVLNMLNTKFLLAGNTRNSVIENDYALGQAWAVNSLITVSNADEELAEVCGLNPGSEAVIDISKFDAPEVASNGSGFIYLQEKKPNYLKYTAEATADVLGVFSEIYYKKGWTAYVDGKETEILRVNYVLRALPITAGEHTIEFRFAPASYSAGNTITWIGCILTLLLFLGAIGVELKKVMAG
ncbi:MAG: YfhO family protein [Cyclobacteriaceae bacterium]